MLYRPRLPNGALAPLNWPIMCYRLVNNICWPLEDDVSRATYLFDRFCWILGFIIFLQHNDAELRYFYVERNNLDNILTGVPTYLILIEIHLRAFQLGWFKESFKTFMQRFYKDIYVDRSIHPKHYRSIQRHLRLTFGYSAIYLAALSLHLVVPILNIIYKRSDLLYKMIYPFDHRPIHVLVPIVLTNIYVGFIVVSMMLGENNLISEMALHLNERYILMREDLHRRVVRVIEISDEGNIAEAFQREVIKTLRRNLELNQFAVEMNRKFSYRVFVMLAFSAILQCALIFKTYTNPTDSLSYVFWSFGKLLDMLCIGEIGSTLIFTTDHISSMYYESNWEEVISRSSNRRQNVRLMKLILMAMEINSKPFSIQGLGFFNVSLRAMMSIIRGAGSYFTCLIALR